VGDAWGLSTCVTLGVLSCLAVSCVCVCVCVCLAVSCLETSGVLIQPNASYLFYTALLQKRPRIARSLRNIISVTHVTARHDTSLIDWFWLRGWLINNRAICTRIALLCWNCIPLFEKPRTRFVGKVTSTNQSMCHTHDCKTLTARHDDTPSVCWINTANVCDTGLFCRI